MTSGSSPFRRRCYRRRGLTLVESVVSTVLVSVTMLAALNAVGMSRLAQTKVSDGRQGHLLALQLMTEILEQEYEEPVDTVDFGRESSESGGDRADWDDVDDYDGMTFSPPEYSDGTEMDHLTGWERSVDVVWVNPANASLVVGTDQGVKRITVTVKHNGKPVAELVALKTIGLPPLEACCLDDGSCEDLRVEACAANSGTSQGADTECIATVCPAVYTVLFVVADDTNPTTQELARRDLIESWDFGVELISDSALQSEFDAEVATADLVYVPGTIDGVVLGDKLRGKAIGIVNENPKTRNALGISDTGIYPTGVDLMVTDNTHDITSPFSTGTLTVFPETSEIFAFGGEIAPGLTVLMEAGSIAALGVLEPGAQLFDGGSAMGRRVNLPWGGQNFDINVLTADGRTLMKRAFDWAVALADLGPSCGDGNCDTGEECSCPEDCGAPAAYEEPGMTCDDGIDNDCDGDTDCDDFLNCFADLACSCGNTICDPGEDCNSCSADCDSKTNGPSSGRYCCGNGIVESAEGDGSICDGNY